MGFIPIGTLSECEELTVLKIILGFVIKCKLGKNGQVTVLLNR